MAYLSVADNMDNNLPLTIGWNYRRLFRRNNRSIGAFLRAWPWRFIVLGETTFVTSIFGTVKDADL
jgi:hypothetical protein